MQPQHLPQQRRFIIPDASGDAYVSYLEEEGRVVFTHTFVPHSRRGQGVAEALMKAGVAWVEASGRQPDATCSYAQTFLERYRSK